MWDSIHSAFVLNLLIYTVLYTEFRIDEEQTSAQATKFVM